jgi:ABC-2 type transport system permease protein
MNAALTAQTRTELTLTLRRGESVLLTLGIPLLLLVFFSLVDVLPHGEGDAVDFLAPGILALAVMSTGMVSLGIATAFERQYGVLKRLGSTPLGRPRLLAAKVTSILAIEVIQTIVIVVAALLLGWDPAFQPLAIVAIVLGTIAFGGLGLLMAGTLRAEVTLAAANGLYLVLLLLGGMVVPLDKLPAWLQRIADLLPAGALTQALTGTLTAGGSVPARAWAVLVVWAILTPSLAAATFRWE